MKEVIKKMQKRIMDHQHEHGFETVFDFLNEDLYELEKGNKKVNGFIIGIAELLKMDTDGIGYDDLKFSIDDFEDAINKLISNK